MITKKNLIRNYLNIEQFKYKLYNEHHTFLAKKNYFHMNTHNVVNIQQSDIQTDCKLFKQINARRAKKGVIKKYVQNYYELTILLLLFLNIFIFFARHYLKI